MGIKFKVKITTKDMYDFMLYHAYTGVMGIMSVVCALVVIILSINTLRTSSDPFIGYVMLFFAVCMVVFLPLSLLMTSHSQVANGRRFQTPIEYAFSGKGIQISQDGKQVERPWEDVVKAVATRKSVFLYTSRVSAIILPKTAIGERYADLVEMIYKNVPNKNVKIKNVG